MRKKGIHTSTQRYNERINSLKVMKFSHAVSKVTIESEITLPLLLKILSLMKITQPDKGNASRRTHFLNTEFVVAKIFVSENTFACSADFQKIK